MKQQRKFAGIWIPAEIWESKNLSILEKIMLVEIDSLDNEFGCTANNQYFANFFELSKTRISQVISSLEDKEFITLSFDKSSNRCIKVVKIGGLENCKGGLENCKGGLENCKHNNTSNNTSNNNNILSISKNENEIEQPQNSLQNDIKEIIDVLNENAQTEYRANAKKTQTLIKALLLDYKKEVILSVIVFKCKEWVGTEYEKYLRPDTLFGNKFEGYAQQAKIAQRKEKPKPKIESSLPPPLPKEETEYEKALKEKYYKK